MKKRHLFTVIGLISVLVIIGLVILPTLSGSGGIAFQGNILVVDAEGNPVEGATVLYGQSPDACRPVAMSDSHGLATFNVPAGWGYSSNLFYSNHSASLWPYMVVSKGGFKTTEVDLAGRRYEWKEILGVTYGRPEHLGTDCILVKKDS